MSLPLVTVVCLCYNHEKFVREAILSVIGQDYPNVEVIVVDDHSTDNSRLIIKDVLSQHPNIRQIFLEENIGNCAAFNRALSLAQGEFVIDFATDDVMMTDKISRQVEKFSQLDDSYAVVFTDAEYVDEHGNVLRRHFEYLQKHGLIGAVPQGDVYRQVLRRHFLPSQTLMVRTAAMRELQGYDEDLSYEDFDFWVRSSRHFKYAFLDQVLMKIRKVSTQMSAQLYKPGDRQLHSTYIVCTKAFSLNRSEEENVALSERVKYEIRHSILTNNTTEALLFFGLLKKLNHVSFQDRVTMVLGRIPLPWHRLRNLYQRLRYRSVS